MLNIGLQTYTIRELIKNPEAMKKTFKEVSEKGIKHIELAIDYLKMPYSEETFKTIKEISGNFNIDIPSCQVRYNTVIKDYDKAVRIFKILNAKYLTISLIDLKLLLKGYDGIVRFSENLNALKEKFDHDGIVLGHHNHHYEFLRYEGKSVLEIMAEHYRGEFVLDTYWTARGGGNHLVILEKLKGRVSIMHLRDYKIKFSKFDLLGTDTEAGSGNLPFTEILKKAEECGVKYGMIEQSTKTPMDSVTNSLNFLKSL